MTWLPDSRRLAGFVALLVLAGAVILFVGGGMGGPERSVADEPAASQPAASQPAPTPTASATGAALLPDSPSPEPPPSKPVQATDGPSPSSQPVEPSQATSVALVPVVGFWSPDASITREELALALTGRSQQYPRTIVPTEDRAALEEYLGQPLAAAVESGDASAIERAVRRGALGLMRVSDVTPRVRALAIDGASLFGNHRLADIDDWPLLVGGADTPSAWQQAASWTIVAGGDIQLDRWMAYHVRSLEKGVDWPWDGGRVAITGRRCCSDLGHRVPVWERTSDEGEIRALFGGADLALANLEAAAVDNPALWRLGPDFRFSLSFSGDPRLLEGLRNTGFDFLSLANNHIHNAGAAGIRDTRRHLDELNIAFAGAGRDVGRARQPARLEAASQGVVVLPCATVGRMALAERAGAASCSGLWLPEQIAAAAAQGNVVIVFPHWGREYRATPNANQRALAQRWVAAGADVVLGAHPHWAGAVEEIDDALVFYSLGNLAFDQPWSEATMQGVIVELTFHGNQLVQAWLHPTLIVDDVQPNLLDYDAGGRRVIKRMRDASAGLFPD